MPRTRLAPLLAGALLVAAPLRAQDAPDPDRDDLIDHPIGFVRAFAGDNWAVVKAPFELRGNDAWALAGVLTIGGLLLLGDETLSRDLTATADDGIGAAVEDVGDFLDPMGLMGKTNPYWIGGMVLSDLFGWEPGERMFKELLFSHWIAGLHRQGARRLLGRRRPDEASGAYTFDPGEGTSMPSGHAATVIQVAAVASHHIDRWPATVALHGLAGALLYQRVTSGKHWASDVWIGAAWGWGVAQVVMARREASAGAPFGPGSAWTVDPATGGLGVTIPFSGWRP